MFRKNRGNYENLLNFEMMYHASIAEILGKVYTGTECQLQKLPKGNIKSVCVKHI